MKTFALCCQKGGTGKSTTSVALAYGLNRRGYRVLIVDTDSQSNASFMCGVDVVNVDTTLFDVLKGDATIEEAILPVQIGIDIINGGLALAGADMVFTQLGREQLLADALAPVADKYDYCIIDTSPSLGVVVMMAMTAADYLIIPMTADALALQGVIQLTAFIQRIQRFTNPDLRTAGILLTMYNPRAVLSKSIEPSIQAAAEGMASKVFRTRIRRAQAVTDAAALQTDLVKESPKSTAATDYEAFTDELLETIGR